MNNTLQFVSLIKQLITIITTNILKPGKLYNSSRFVE